MTKEERTIRRIRKIYSGMKQRCYNVNADSYKYYGKRGIRICDEWLNDSEEFVEWALKNGYAEKLTIDRIDVNGNYEPSNCRWTTQLIQMQNRRPYKEWDMDWNEHNPNGWSDKSHNRNSKSRTLTARLGNDIADYIEDIVNEEGKSRGVVIGEIVEAYREIDMICQWSGIDPKTCCEQIGDMFRTGEITFENGRLSVR